jgi:mono/diheme cytochrome c family protein
MKKLLYLAPFGALLAAVAGNGAMPLARAPKVTPVSQGKAVYERWCATCHAAGPGMPGTAALAAKYGKDQPAVLEDRRDLTPEVIAYFVRHGVSIMPPFRKTEISDADLAALGAYLEHKQPAADRRRKR